MPRPKGFDFLDAPVSGCQAGAQNGVLTVMVGGGQTPFDRAQTIIAHYARSITLIGPSGAGQLTKMVNQICIAGLVQGLAEGNHFAQKARLGLGEVIEAIAKDAAQSWQMENRWKTMNEGVRLRLRHRLDAQRPRHLPRGGQAQRASLPVAALVDTFYADVQKMGGRRWDTSSPIARLNRPS